MFHSDFAHAEKQVCAGGKLVKILQTNRLILRNFRESDAAALFAYLEAPTARCFLSLKLADLTAAQGEAVQRSQGDEFIAVCLAASGHLIGDPFVHPDPKWPEGADGTSDTASVGWNFNPRFSGQGYALEAARALCADLFANQGMRRLYAYVETITRRRGAYARNLVCARKACFASM